MSRRAISMTLAALAAATLCGCERTMKDMYVQPRLGPDAASPLFPDGKGSRPPPPGSLPVAMGDLAKTSGGRRGRDELDARRAAEAASALPPLTRALLARGQARYDIDCAPCHSVVGDGDGMIVRRGFPRPPSLHQPRLREAPDRHFYDVITHGYGVMAPFADRVTPQDRWAIVSYLRALQFSQDAPVGALPAPVRAALAPLPAASAAAPAHAASAAEAG
jgi:mono/diheme cytochrome c family protein